MEAFIQLTINALVASAPFILLALGFTLIFGATRVYNVAHGAVAIFGAYMTWLALVHWGIAFIPAVLVGMLAGGIIGYLTNKLVYAPLRHRKATAMTLLIASVGLASFLQALTSLIFTDEYRVMSPGSAHVHHMLGGAITSIQIAELACALIVTFALALWLRSTRTGKMVRAISDDAEVATMVGIKSDRILALLFCIGSAVAALGAILNGSDVGFQPSRSFELLLAGVSAAVIGGVGNVYGALIGGLLLGLAENYGIWFIPSEWKVGILFGILILFLLFRPKGIYAVS